ncbi:phosphoribosylglycinamide formyltransferase [Candidatus Peregrinibacteria bacterium]|nr:phosphoribosylglycinamide formyltransferase [Candidatus Peregrinibacteria bacterium]
MKFVVLSSSRGTTFQAVLDRIADGSLSARCVGLVTDRMDRGCAHKARQCNIPILVPDADEAGSYRHLIPRSIMELALVGPGPHPDLLIAAMGWMHIVSPQCIREWPNRILNVHPALLPKHGGRNMFGMKVHEAVIAAGEKESGMTIHVMDEGIDTGKIIFQKTCPVLPTDTPETLKERVQELEKEWYPRVLEMIERGELRLTDERN